MQPRHYYISKNTEGFKHESVTGVKHEAVNHGGKRVIGHLHWEGRDPQKRSAFESQGVIYLGTLFTNKLSPEAVAELSEYGVTATDSVYDALVKVQAVTGGFSIEF